MACSKYTLTNTGTTVINFNYRRCDDAMWQYQIELYPNETKNIWLMDDTFSIAPLFNTNIILTDEGVFPPVYATPTPTPTPSVTPSITPTQTTTPSVTPTNTGTPPVTPTNTSTPTNTQTNTGTPNATSTPTATLELTPTATETQTPTPTNTQTGTPAETPTSTPTNTQTGTPAETPTSTPTNTQTGTPDVTPTPSTTIGATPTSTETQTPTPTVTQTQTPTETLSNALVYISNGDTLNTMSITAMTVNSVAVSGPLPGNTSFPISYPQDTIYYTTQVSGSFTVVVSVSREFPSGSLLFNLEDSNGNIQCVTIDGSGDYTFNNVGINPGGSISLYTDAAVCPTPTPTVTPTNTNTPSVTPTNTETPTPTPTVTGTASVTPSSTPTLTPTPSTTPPSGVIITVYEVPNGSGTNVVMDGSGTLNLTDLTQVGTTTTFTAGINGQSKIVIAGPGGICNRYSGSTFSTPIDYSSAPGGFTTISGAGDTFGAISGLVNGIAVPNGYVSGTYLSGTSVFNNQSINGMSLIPGTYVFSWGTGINADDITLIIQPPITPSSTPASTTTPTVTPTITNTPTNTGTAAVTPTPTNTNTPTNTETPTQTPTPSPTPAFRVLYLGGADASTEASDIQTYLTNTGYSMTYSAVTLDTSYDGSGGITTSEYDAVLLYTPLETSGGTYSATLGTAISDYVSGGGNLVTAANIWRTYPSGFNHSGLTAFNANGNTATNGANSGFLVQSVSNSILSGASQTFSTAIRFNGLAAFPGSQLNVSSGSRLYSVWGAAGAVTVNQLAYKKVGSSKLVSFNGYSADLSNFGSTGNLTKIYGNSILFALGFLPEPTSFITVRNDDTTATAIITGITVSGLTGVQPVGLPVSGDTLPMSGGGFNTGFTTTEWGSTCTVSIGVDFQTPLPSGNFYIFMTDSNNIFNISYTQTGGVFTINGYIGNNVSFPTQQAVIGIGYDPS